jgi:pyruvyltransferase
MIDHENKTISTWWPSAPSPGNFGDILTPYLIKKISGYTAKRTNPPIKTPTFLGVGSIISRANEFTTVWGSGIMNYGDAVSNKATYLAVRGPISREVILAKGGRCPEIYGDPGLILPLIYKPTISKKYTIGIIPHYVDYEQVAAWYRKDKNVKVINLLNSDPTLPLKEILECETVLSSSLHGIIEAVAYGIPVAWVKYSDKLSGDGVKFADFFASINVDHACTVIDQIESIETMKLIKTIKTYDFDVRPLLDVFPIK